jgi:sugar lactone lactonase YvrE
LGFRPDGELAVVSMCDRRRLTLGPAGLREFADLSPYVRGPINDMVITSDGAAYIGGFGFDPDRPGDRLRPTVLVRVAPDGTVAPVADDLLFPNGVVLTPDERTLLVAETYQLLDFVDTAELTIYAVALGGPDRRTLYMCAAPPLTDGEPSRRPDASLLRSRVPAPGVGGTL